MLATRVSFFFSPKKDRKKKHNSALILDLVANTKNRGLRDFYEARRRRSREVWFHRETQSEVQQMFTRYGENIGDLLCLDVSIFVPVIISCFLHANISAFIRGGFIILCRLLPFPLSSLSPKKSDIFGSM